MVMAMSVVMVMAMIILCNAYVYAHSDVYALIVFSPSL